MVSQITAVGYLQESIVFLMAMTLTTIQDLAVFERFALCS